MDETDWRVLIALLVSYVSWGLAFSYFYWVRHLPLKQAAVRPVVCIALIPVIALWGIFEWWEVLLWAVGTVLAARWLLPGLLRENEEFQAFLKGSPARRQAPECAPGDAPRRPSGCPGTSLPGTDDSSPGQVDPK